MGKVDTFFKLLIHDRTGLRKAMVDWFSEIELSHFLSDELFLKIKFYAYIGKKLNVKVPKTFNEKLQWLKLYDRKPEYTKLVDKYLVREFVAERIGEEFLIPLIGVWDRAEDIDFEKLPNQFVLKCNHDSGSVIICRDKAEFDVEMSKKKLKRQLDKNLFWWGREWPYKNIKPCIIAEQYVEDPSSGELRDYKFMCFGGKVKCSFVCSDRFSGKGLHVTFFDRDWSVMPFERHYPSRKDGLAKPQNYEQMMELSEKLSAGIPFVRVDFYEVNGRVYFGELTLYPGCGFEEFTPKEWDETLGSWIMLPGQTLAN